MYPNVWYGESDRESGEKIVSNAFKQKTIYFTDIDGLTRLFPFIIVHLLHEKAIEETKCLN